MSDDDLAERDLMEAYARLKALHDNLPDRPNRLIEPRYVEEFHGILALLQQHVSFDLGRFIVTAGAITLRDPETWYDLHFMKAKIEGLASTPTPEGPGSGPGV